MTPPLFFSPQMLKFTPLSLSRCPSFHSSARGCFCKMSTKPGPLVPNFIPVEQSGVPSLSQHNGFSFSLVSYNILAQVYVKSSLFPHSPPPSLKWKARSQAVLTVLKNLNSDFLCLQEVDEYDSFYRGNMENFGYSSIYVQRSGQKRDGCGIFYRQSSAELVMEEKIEYNDLVDLVMDTPTSSGGSVEINLDRGSDPQSTQGGRGDPNDPRVRLKRDCVGVLALFKLKNPYSHHLIVANTHIYWDPEWADVKLAQAKYLLSRLAHFKMLVSQKMDCTPPVIIAGDFNSTPGDQVYQYMVSGSSEVRTSETDDELPLPLHSVYAQTRGEPQFTNCTPDFTGTLDYIFFSPSADIQPISYLELPEPECPDVTGGLPNYHHPSDHLPVGAEFNVLQG